MVSGAAADVAFLRRCSSIHSRRKALSSSSSSGAGGGSVGCGGAIVRAEEDCCRQAGVTRANAGEDELGSWCVRSAVWEEKSESSLSTLRRARDSKQGSFRQESR